MPTTRPATRWSALGLVFCLLMTAPAGAQEDAADQIERLRAENTALRARVSELEASLAAIRAQLEAILRSLPMQGGPPGSQPAASQLLPEDPTACPDSLAAWMLGRYQARFPAFESGPEHRDAVRAWAEDHARMNLGRVRWLATGTISQPGSSTSDPLVSVQVFNDATGRPLGGPALIRLPTSIARTLNADPDRAWILEGMLIPSPVFAPDRPTPGPFNDPPLLGPYAAFGLLIDRPRLLEAPRGIVINPQPAPAAQQPPAGR